MNVSSTPSVTPAVAQAPAPVAGAPAAVTVSTAPAAPVQQREAEKAAREEARQPDEKQLAREVERLNSAIRVADDHLEFKIHKETHTPIVRLVDSATEEVLREFPAEKFLDMVVMLQKIAGFNVDVSR